MTRFSATALDLSRVNRSALWPEHSFAQIEAARMADLAERFEAAGIAYDVDPLQTDSSRILHQSGGYRELLLAQGIDDAQANNLLAFASGPFLDRLGDLHGTARAEGETDDRYRARIQLAPEAFSSAGTPGGYIYHAVSASPLVRDVGLTVVNKATWDVGVEITILSSAGNGEPTDELMRLVRQRLLADEVRLATDNLMVRAAKVVPYDVTAVLQLRTGPDPALIKANATTALQSAGERYKRVGGDVPRNALEAALYVAGVERVVMAAPAADVTTLRFEAAHLRTATITTEVIRD
jgi:phage-related baseplate assembly protein